MAFTLECDGQDYKLISQEPISFKRSYLGHGHEHNETTTETCIVCTASFVCERERNKMEERERESDRHGGEV